MLCFLSVARRGAGGWCARGGGGRVAVVGFEVKLEQFHCYSSDRMQVMIAAAAAAACASSSSSSSPRFLCKLRIDNLLR